MPDNLFAHVELAATYSLSGRDDEARAEAAEVLRIEPNFSLKHQAETSPYKNQGDTDRLIDAL